MAKILGKFSTTASHEIPRGADVCLHVDVPAAWLSTGSMIEVELPRNLTCARCSGGGCGACNNAGAITLRGKTELPEVVQVSLPMQRSSRGHGSTAAASDESLTEAVPESQPKSARPIVIRIPECGGLPNAAHGELIRGWLLLEVGIADRPSPNVRWLDVDDDPLSSSKLLRAEVRPSGREAAGTGDSAKLVTAARSIRPSRRAPDSDAPPSSRVARVGSTVPPNVQRAGDADGSSAIDAAKSSAKAQGRTWMYVAIVTIAAIGVLALSLL